MDEPTPEFDPPPELRRCAVCGEAASYGFGPPGGPVQPAGAWYCATHRRGRAIGAGLGAMAARHAAINLISFRRVRRVRAFDWAQVGDLAA
jgi:hypothetical protein